MRDLKKRAFEEKALMLKVFMEDAKTEEDVMRAKLDFDFVQDCLEVAKMRTLLSLGKKKAKSGLHEYYDLIEHLLERRIEKEYQLGLAPIAQIKLHDIESVWYNFHVSHIILKGSRKIKHTNKLTFLAKTEKGALDLFYRKIKDLKHELDFVIEVTKSLSGVFLKDGEYYGAGTFDIVRENLVLA